MATLSGRRRWRRPAPKTPQARTLRASGDARIPTPPDGPALPLPILDRLAWPGLGGRSLRPPAGRSLLAAAPPLLLLTVKGGAARSRPHRRGAGRDRRPDGASPGASLSALPAFGTRGWTRPAAGEHAQGPTAGDLRCRSLTCSDGFGPDAPFGTTASGPPRRAAPSQVAGF